MARSSRILIPESVDLLPGLPQGLPRHEAADYFLSRTYAKILGDDLPRRAVLLRLATTMAFVALPLRPARAVPLVPVAISAVAIGASIIKVFKNTFGTFEAQNDEEAQVKGYVSITVFDTRRDTAEGSITARYSFPANTSVTITFNRGPAPTTKGNKKIIVAAEDSSDEDEFEAA